MDVSEKKLCWKQLVALTRHNLLAASRTRDFTFFKNLQSQVFFSGIDHVATLAAALGDEADSVVSGLDKFNTVMGCVHEDAFKALYESVKATGRDDRLNSDERIAMYHVEASQQRKTAAITIDKMFDMADTLIQQQAPDYREEATKVFIMGTTLIADAIQETHTQIDRMELIINHSVCLEESLELVQSAVSSAISAMKGVFSLMAVDAQDDDTPRQNTSPHSLDSYARGMLRKVSTALSTSSSSSHELASASRRTSFASAASRRNSTVSNYQYSPNRVSFSMASSSDPAQRRMKSGNTHTLSPIPPTPADTLLNPFEADYVNSSAFRKNSSANATSGRQSRPRADSVELAPSDNGSPMAPSSETAGRLRGMSRPRMPDTMPSLCSTDSNIYDADPMSAQDDESPSFLRRLSSAFYAAPIHSDG